jgi:hypothetical protein
MFGAKLLGLSATAPPKKTTTQLSSKKMLTMNLKIYK